MAVSNKEGLTLAEWLAAANQQPFSVSGVDPRTFDERSALRKAWQLGEDPTEYAVKISKG